jgi:hypothetical protein
MVRLNHKLKEKTNMNNKTETEIWKTYPDFDFIQGSNLGRVRTLDRYVPNGKNGKRFVRGRVLKQYRESNGYMRVHVGINNKEVKLSVHRVIASCFLPNPGNLGQINHKDCNRANNAISNLEWCTHKQNIVYRDKLGHTARSNAPKSPLFAVNLDTLEPLWFESQSEAGRQLGADVGSINKVIKGKQKTAKGYWFVEADSKAVDIVKSKLHDIGKIGLKIE